MPYKKKGFKTFYVKPNTSKSVILIFGHSGPKYEHFRFPDGNLSDNESIFFCCNDFINGSCIKSLLRLFFFFNSKILTNLTEINYCL